MGPVLCLTLLLGIDLDLDVKVTIQKYTLKLLLVKPFLKEHL